MANEKDDEKKKSKKPTDSKSGLANTINSLIGRLYRNTFFTPNDTKLAYDQFKNDIDNTIDNLIAGNVDANGGNNLSNVINRVNLKAKKDSEEEKNALKELEDLMNDDGKMDKILSIYMENRYIRDQDAEIDAIIKYVPQLQDALDLVRDNVLSADDFSKDFITVNNVSKIGDLKNISNKVAELKRTYNLLELIESIYDNVSKYGEQFIYILPYNKAFSRLKPTDDKEVGPSQQKQLTPGITLEAGVYKVDGVDKTSAIFESAKISTDMSFEVIFEECAGIRSVLERAKNIKKSSEVKSEPVIDKDEVKFDSYSSDTSSNDGLVDPSAPKKKNLYKIPGCIVKKLDRKDVIPIYIDDINLGYYYIETNRDDSFEFIEAIHDPISSMKKTEYVKQQEESKANDELLKKLAKSISDKIDSNFINANQDLKKELYTILKYNSDRTEMGKFQMKVTYIPPEDMVHFYFKRDPRTNRGISDLYRSLLPAKLYASLYTGDSVGIMTRGFDKRVYYVKQYVDTNISKLLLSTINQLKKDNFGMREINNINTIMGVQSRFTDHIVPVSQSGDKPIEFEIMPGQDIQPKTELQEMLKKMAINPIAPYELVEDQPVDYATRLVQTNSKFMRKSIKRQSIFQSQTSSMITKIYNLHFDANEQMEVLLPPPAHLNATNLGDLVNNVSSFAGSMADMEFGDSPAGTDVRAKEIYKKKVFNFQISTFIPQDKFAKLKELARLEAAAESISAPSEES